MSASKNLEYEKNSFLNKSNSAFIERMYLKFVNKDADLPDSWKDYFEGIGDELNIIAKEINGPSWGPKKNTVDIDELQKKIDQEEQNSNGITVNNNGVSPSSSRSNEDSIKAVSMIRSYRQRGHLIAKLDPLELMKSDYLDELHPESFGFKKTDYQKNIYLGGVINRQNSNIKEILSFLKKTYCGPVGYEYMHISNPTERKWFRDRIEKSDDNLNFTKNGKEAILNKDIKLFGTLMSNSHKSYAEDFEASTKDVDEIVERSKERSASSGTTMVATLSSHVVASLISVTEILNSVGVCKSLSLALTVTLYVDFVS